MSRRRSALLPAARLGLLALAVAAMPLAAEETAAAEAEEETATGALPAELLEAETVVLMDAAVMDPDLTERFRSALEDWNRFEIVLFPDEADILMALSARSDFTSRTVDEECDPDDPLCGRAEGTTQIFETLYLKVFVQGGDDLWTDEEPVGESDEAAERLVDRLRARIEEAGSEQAGAEESPTEESGSGGEG